MLTKSLIYRSHLIASLVSMPLLVFWSLFLNQTRASQIPGFIIREAAMCTYVRSHVLEVAILNK